MALRVLLADESSTIKKVFQLALQDFAVEVKPVNVGVDVSAVAQSFQPDIIFADVLLQKKNGYDVSAEIKQTPDLKKTPVVLMWSGFMDLDEDKMQASGADAQLEKPFDVKSLRQLIQDLVPRTKDQNISSFLSFPKIPDFEDSTKEKAQKLKETQSSDDPPQDWNMESFDPPPELHSSPTTEDDEFHEVSLKPQDDSLSIQIPPRAPGADSDLLSTTEEDPSDGNSWEQKDLAKYRLEDDLSMTESSEPDVNYIVPEEPVFDPDSIMGRSPQTEEPEIEVNPPTHSTHENKAGTIEDSLEIELENPHNDGSPSGFEVYSEDPKAQNPDPELYTPTSSSAPKTILLNFTLDGENSNVDGLSQTGSLSKITAQLNEDEIRKRVEEQAEKIIQDVVWKVVPEVAERMIERELKRLMDENSEADLT